MICHGSIFLPRYEFPGFPGNKEVTDKRAPVQARRRRLASGAAAASPLFFLIFNFSDEEKKQSTRITLTLTLDNAQQLLVDPE